VVEFQLATHVSQIIFWSCRVYRIGVAVVSEDTMQTIHCVTSLSVPGSPCHWAAYGFLAILLLATTIRAQEAKIEPGGTSADCTNADLASTLHVYRAPDHIQVIAVDYRNVKTIACVLRPDGGPQQGPLLTLEPGATAHTSLRWSPPMRCFPDRNTRGGAARDGR
jgi:hypothetical protein